MSELHFFPCLEKKKHPVEKRLIQSLEQSFKKRNPNIVHAKSVDNVVCIIPYDGLRLKLCELLARKQFAATV